MTDISICIPTYERPEILDNTLTTLSERVRKSKKKIQVVVTDNSLDTKTKQVVDKFRQHLTIQYFRQPSNVGGLNNMLTAFRLAKGKYCLYLADDDELDLDVVEDILAFLDSHDSVNVVFAPWFCRTSSHQVEQYYQQTEKIKSVNQGDYLQFLLHVLKTSMLPEIFIFRNGSVAPLRHVSNISQFYLLQASSFVEQGDLVFWGEPYYTQNIHTSVKGEDLQVGHKEAMDYWDRYRGGLECMLAKAQLPGDTQLVDDFLKLINVYVARRMAISVKLRYLLNAGSKLDLYILALRASALGSENLLPLALSHFKKMAAFEFVLLNIKNADQFDGIFLDLDLTNEEASQLLRQASAASIVVHSTKGRNSLSIGDDKTIPIQGVMHSFPDILASLL